MALRIDNPSPPNASVLLRHCYLFVSRDWQHLPRDGSPDQGFETKFREGCVTKLGGWVVSQNREMNFGLGLMTASGALHEIDLVAQGDPVLGVMELKNRQGWVPDKNDVIVFFAKILDYLCLTPSLLRATVVPVFMSAFGFEASGLAACLGLGIHPVAPYLRPVPVLIDNARCMLAEKAKGAPLSTEDDDALEDFCSNLTRITNALAGAQLNNRFVYRNDATIEVSAFGSAEVYTLADELRSLNGESDRLLEVFRQGKLK